MADRYVWNAAAGSGTGATWANAHTTMAAAITASTAGDRFFVAHDHAETTAAALPLTFKGTQAAPDQIICANRAGSVPPVSADLRTTGTVSTTAAASNITINGTFYCYGLTFQAGSVASAANIVIGTAAGKCTFKNCNLTLNNTNGASTITFGPAAISTQTSIAFNDVKLKFNNVTQSLVGASGLRFDWVGGSVDAAGTVPTTLITSGTRAGAMYLEGVDLSALGSGKTIFAIQTSYISCSLKDCKLGTSVTVAVTPSNQASRLLLVRCDSGDTNYRQELYAYEGTLTTETTIVRTGGASDGTTLISWKVVTTANSKWQAPCELYPITIWNETVGSSITLTVECIASAVLNNDDIWMDIEYLGTSGFPLGNFATSGKADILATNAANPTSTQTWGGALTGKFKLTKAITPQEKGPITVYVKVGKASQTVYVDPKITVT